MPDGENRTSRVWDMAVTNKKWLLRLAELRPVWAKKNGIRWNFVFKCVAFWTPASTNGFRIMLWSCSNSFYRIRWDSMNNRFRFNRQCYVRGLWCMWWIQLFCETRIKCVSNLLVIAQPLDSFCFVHMTVVFHCSTFTRKIIILVVLLVVPFGRTPVYPALKSLHGNQEACLRALLTVQLNWSIESKCLRARTHLHTASKWMYIHLTHKCPWKTISMKLIYGVFFIRGHGRRSMNYFVLQACQARSRINYCDILRPVDVL